MAVWGREVGLSATRHVTVCGRFRVVEPWRGRTEMEDGREKEEVKKKEGKKKNRGESQRDPKSVKKLS